MLGEKLKQARKVKGLSLNDLSFATEIGVPTIWRIEKGDSKCPTWQTVAKLAKALDLSLDELAKE